MSKASSKLVQKMKASRAAASRRAREGKHEFVRKGVNAATSYAVGKSTGWLQSLPTIFGMPRTTTLAIVGGAVSMMTSGVASAVGEGVLDSGLALTMFQLGTGQTVAGVEGRRRPPMSPRARALEDDIEDELDRVEGVEREHRYVD